MPDNASIYLPLVSIITPSWNSADYIEQTILSVSGQTYPRIEHIVIDGGSTDGTLEIIKRYEDDIARWISEPDGGMYQAINKGMKAASGDIVAYLNSDDLYFPNTIEKVVELFRIHQDADLLYGDLDVIDQHGQHMYTQKYPSYDWLRFTSSKYAMIGQPAAFWKRSLWDKAEGFDENMKMAADFDFFVRAGRVGKMQHVRDVLAAFRLHPGSLTSNHLALSNREIQEIHRRYLKPNISHGPRSFVSDLMFKALNWNALLHKLAHKFK